MTRPSAKSDFMSSEEFERLLSETGIGQRELARLVGAGEATPQRWAAGTSRIPGSVAILLRLIRARPELKTVIEECAVDAG